MDEQIPGIDHDDLFNDINDSGLADDVLESGDFIDNVHGLKGLISRALGNLVFKAAVIIFILYNFVYTFYTAIQQSATEETTLILNNCSCESKDRMFYAIFTFTTIGLWLLFFFIHELFRLYKFIAEKRKDKVHDSCKNGGSEDMQDSQNGEAVNIEEGGADTVDAENMPASEDRNAEYMSQKFVSQELLVFFYHIHRIYSQNIHKPPPKHNISKGIDNFLEGQKIFVASPMLQICDYITDRIKYILISIQFVVRLPVVPLLLLQWLDEYAWKCAFGHFKDYCSDRAKSYHVDQSLVVYVFYMCILLAIVIAAMIDSLPKLPSRDYSRIKVSKKFKKWFLLFKVPHSIFFPSFDFIIVFTLIYVSVLAQFTYSAVSETEEDIISGRLFTINNNWSNVSISGGVSNAVLWECTDHEQSNSNFFKVVFAIALIIPGLLLFAILSPLMVLLRYKKVKELLGDHKILLALDTAVQQILQLERSDAKKIKQIIANSLIINQNRNSTEIRQSYRWTIVFFILPLLEHTLIYLLIALILTSYNLNPLGCFLHTVDYNEITETVFLKASRAVYIYQEVAVSLALGICVVWIACKALQIYFTHSPNMYLIDAIMNVINLS